MIERRRRGRGRRLMSSLKRSSLYGERIRGVGLETEGRRTLNHRRESSHLAFPWLSTFCCLMQSGCEGLMIIVLHSNAVTHVRKRTVRFATCARLSIHNEFH